MKKNYSRNSENFIKINSTLQASKATVRAVNDGKTRTNSVQLNQQFYLFPLGIL